VAGGEVCYCQSIASFLLQDTVEQLRARCDELSAREQLYAVSWQKDSDVRQQMALEVNSLQVVLEQKNDEIRRLRQRQSDLETKVPAALAILFGGQLSSRVRRSCRCKCPTPCSIVE